MANPLLDRVLPGDLADRSQVVDVKGKIRDFGRLRDIAESELKSVSAAERPRDWLDSPVEVTLEFRWLDTGRELVQAGGRIRATLPAVCQRCLEAFELVVDTPVRVVFDQPGGDLAHDDYDAWEFDGTAILLQDVVEETVVMALPLAPLHDAGSECAALAGKRPEAGPETTRPFADLRSRMEAKDN